MTIALAAAWLYACGGDETPPATDATTGDRMTSTAGTSAPIPGDESDTTAATTSTSSGDVTSIDPADTSESGATFNIDLCGDGELDPGEQCDDGNRMNGDACSAGCQPTFEIRWTATHDGPSSGMDAAYAVEVDANDAIYVGGYQWAGENTELWLQQYQSDGAPGWTLTWLEPNAIGAGGLDLLWDLNGELLVLGSSVPASAGNDMLVMRVDSVTGVLLDWSTFDAPGDVPDAPIHAIARKGALDPSGNLVILGALVVPQRAGYVTVTEIAPSGELQWQQSSFEEQTPDALAVSSDGTIYVLAQTDAFPFWRMEAYADDGTPLGEISLDFGVNFRPDALTMTSGEFLLVGDNAVGIALYRTDEQWIPTWMAQGTHGHATAVAEGPGGAAHAAGLSFGQRSSDAWAGGFHADGSPWWSDVYANARGNGQDWWRDVAVDGLGDVIVVGNETTIDQAQNIIVRKYRPL